MRTAEVVVRGPTVAADARRGDPSRYPTASPVIDSDGRTDGAFTVELVRETLARTSLKGVAVGTKVNRGGSARGRAPRRHIVQGQSTASARSSRGPPASAELSCASSCRPQRRPLRLGGGRSPSTASRLPCRVPAVHGGAHPGAYPDAGLRGAASNITSTSSGRVAPSCCLPRDRCAGEAAVLVAEVARGRLRGGCTGRAVRPDRNLEQAPGGTLAAGRAADRDRRPAAGSRRLTSPPR